jgi:tetratricopeptide (TPR) repeat protein
MVFAGAAVAWMVSWALKKDYRRLGYSVAGVVVLFAVLHANFYRIDPMSGFAQSYYRLGIIQQQKGQSAEAVVNFRKAVDLDNSLAPAYLNLGILLSGARRYDEAKSELTRAIRLDSTYAKAYYNLGLVYAEKAAYDSAFYMMDRALGLIPDYRLATLAKASLFYETARFDIAERMLRELRGDASIGPHGARQVDGLLNALPRRKRWTAGRPSERQRMSDGYLLKGDNLLSLGLADRALETYLMAVRTDSLSGLAMLQVGTLYYNLDRPDDADRYFEAALRATSGLEGAHLARGVIAFRKGDVEKACSEFELELEVDPGSAGSHINLAMCYEEHLGDLRRAAHHLSRYIELTGGTEELKRHLKELEAKSDNAID